jgi:hypothetical protein
MKLEWKTKRSGGLTNESLLISFPFAHVQFVWYLRSHAFKKSVKSQLHTSSAFLWGVSERNLAFQQGPAANTFEEAWQTLHENFGVVDRNPWEGSLPREEDIHNVVTYFFLFPLGGTGNWCSSATKPINMLRCILYYTSTHNFFRRKKWQIKILM